MYIYVVALFVRMHTQQTKCLYRIKLVYKIYIFKLALAICSDCVCVFARVDCGACIIIKHLLQQKNYLRETIDGDTANETGVLTHDHVTVCIFTRLCQAAGK